jgi:hypothetical protein
LIVLAGSAACLLGSLLALPSAEGERIQRAQGLTLSIDPCVEVDEEQVRRLVELELGASAEPGRERVQEPMQEPMQERMGDSVAVTVGCVNRVQEVRVEDSMGRPPLVRNIDLRALEPAGRDARSRELALAIAELVRRRGVALDEKKTPPPPAPPVPTPTEVSKSPQSPASSAAYQASPAQAGRWRLEAGALGTLDRFSGGQDQIGADLILRIHMGSWIVAQVRIGDREIASLTVPNGQLHARAFVGGLALGVRLGSAGGKVGFAVLGSLQGQVLRFRAESDGGAMVHQADLAALIAGVGPVAWIAVGRRLSLIADAGVGRALHGITVRSQGASSASPSGLVLSGGLGVVTEF